MLVTTQPLTPTPNKVISSAVPLAAGVCPATCQLEHLARHLTIARSGPFSTLTERHHAQYSDSCLVFPLLMPKLDMCCQQRSTKS